MPELPEVETTLRGIQNHILHKEIKEIKVRQPHLRWQVPTEQIVKALEGNSFSEIYRRAKYLVLKSQKGSLLIHLGMSGSLRIFSAFIEPEKHDHIDIIFNDKKLLRFRDPRRFGSFLWTETPNQHPLLENLGPEPLGNSFSGQYLFELSRGRKAPLKNFIMNSKIVVGVGNIYANEALFKAGLRPQRKSGKVTLNQFESLASSIKILLQSSIDEGGTTLRDFVGTDNKPGYFKQQLMVYGRKNKRCKFCSALLKELKISHRSSIYCPQCQQ